MSSLSSDTTLTENSVQASSRSRIEGNRFNWLFVGLSLWYLSGLHIDGWAHSHGRVDESFFTIWHAVFYSGFASTAGILLYAMWHNRRQSASWFDAIPRGYGIALLGSLIFFVGGFGDMLWHTFFGIEQGTEALISPTHLTLAAGMALVLNGPINAAWTDPSSTKTMPWYAVMAATFALSGIAFITGYLNPVYQLLPNRPIFSGSLKELSVGLGLGGIIFFAIVLTGMSLIFQKRWRRLPIGFFTVLIGVTTGFSAIMNDHYHVVPALVIAGMGIDLLYLILRPSEKSEWRIRLFAVGLPLIYYGFYYQAIWSRGLWWSEHVWGGSIFLGAAAGLLVSYLVFPPKIPASAEGDA